MNVTLYVVFGRGTENFPYEFSVIGPIEVTMGIMSQWAMNIVRISMCLMLLSLKEGRMWKWTFWILIAIQLSLIIAAICVQFAICRPLYAIWTFPPVPGAVCISQADMMLYAYIYHGKCQASLQVCDKRLGLTHCFTAFNIISDVIISTMPLIFIRKIRRSLSEKILLCGLMSTGLLATAAAVVFLATVLGTFSEHDAALTNIWFDIWSTLQLFLAVIAANLPCLKSPAHRLLVRWGCLRARATAADGSPDSFLSKMTSGSHFAAQLRELVLSDRKESNGPASSIAAILDQRSETTPRSRNASRGCTDVDGEMGAVETQKC
jgi:hypothetical protein